MKGDPIYYRKGYKYQLSRDATTDLKLFVPFPALFGDIITEYIVLTSEGVLWNKRGYAWDGCSGPTWDDKTNMRGGMVHDSFYQLIRLGLLPPAWKEYADDLLRAICLAKGMSSIRGWYYHEGVKDFGGKAAQPGYEPYPELTAP